MASYRVEFKKSARKELIRLEPSVRDRINQSIQTLADNPIQVGSRKLVGSENVYRIRVGDYRVIYEMHDEILVIFVIRIGHRKDIYR